MAAISKVLFIGSKKQGFKCLSLIHSLAPDLLIGIITIDDRGDARSVYDDFHAFAFRYGIKIFVVKSSDEFENLIKKLRPELCIVVGWYWLVNKEVLACVPNGFVGIHNSLLPKYRGGSPLIWAIINGDDNVGVSLFSFAEGMDEGDIWGQRIVAVKSSDYISDVLEKIESKTISLITDKYQDILHGAIEPIPQNHYEATYCAQRCADDGLINWQNSAKQVYDFIRAQAEPYPGAFTFYNGNKLIVRRAHLPDIIYYGTPGQVAKIEEDGVYIICGDNKPVVLDVVQMESCNKLFANEVVKSIKTRLVYPFHTK